MGRRLFYKPGSFYRVDDRSGFPTRAERTKKEWNGLDVDERLWEPRQPQDLVRGVPDNQTVPDARPLGPNIFVGPIYVELSETALLGASFLNLESIAGLASGDPIGVVLDSDQGNIFRTNIFGSPTSTGVVLANPLPYQASSGNLMVDYKPGSGTSISGVLTTDSGQTITTDSGQPITVNL